MGLTVKTLGCNGLCGNCYENVLRQKKHSNKLEMEKVLAVIRKEGDKPSKSRCNSPCIHGGEPLLLPISDLEILLKEIFKIWGRTGIQTNGILLNEAHIKLFKKYNTSVGISLDGDTAEMNRGRWNLKPVSDQVINIFIESLFLRMHQMKKENIPMSIISVLRTYNASEDNIDSFINFLKRMHSEFGIYGVRTNPVIAFNPEFKSEELTPEQVGYALIKLFDACNQDKNYQWLPARDIFKLLLGFSKATCIFLGCDPWSTNAESPINVDGMVGNCLKSGGSQEGVFVETSDFRNDLRQMVLYHIPFDLGGCGGCTYWHICHGGCPGEAEGGDYRNKTRFCLGWKAFFEHGVKTLKGFLPNLKTVDEFYPSFPHKGETVSFLNSVNYRQEKRPKESENYHGDAHGDHGDNHA